MLKYSTQEVESDICDVAEFVEEFAIKGTFKKLKKRPDDINGEWHEGLHYEVTLIRANKVMQFYLSTNKRCPLTQDNVAVDALTYLGLEEDCEVGLGYERWLSNNGGERGFTTDPQKYYLYALVNHKKLVDFLPSKKALALLVEVDK
jgi:hypothetical protein